MMDNRLEPVSIDLSREPPAQDPPHADGPNGANGKRLLTGTMDQMLVWNDPATQCQRSMKINGYVYSDDTVAEVNKRADLAHEVLERQFLLQDLKRMEHGRDEFIKGMKQQRDYLKELSGRQAERRSGKNVKTLTAQEMKTVNEGEEKIRSNERGLADLEERIAKTKQLCGIE
jgi:hypothetical protein